MSIIYALSLLEHYGSVFWLSILLFVGFAIVTVVVIIRERERESSIRQLLKSLPLRDRLLGRYPKDLLERPLPPPVPPRLPDRAMAALVLLIINGVMVLLLGITLFIFLRLLFPLPPSLGVSSQWLSWFPLIMAVICSGFLFVGSILIWMKRYLAGGIIGIIFGAITIGLLTGVLGIIGGILALTSKEPKQSSS
jgi:MFS family permease